MDSAIKTEDLCRLCCKVDGVLIDVFNNKLDEDIAANVLVCFGINITPEDKITKKICKQCFFLINSYTELKALAIINDNKLKKEHETRENIKNEEKKKIEEDQKSVEGKDDVKEKKREEEKKNKDALEAKTVNGDKSKDISKQKSKSKTNVEMKAMCKKDTVVSSKDLTKLEIPVSQENFLGNLLLTNENLEKNCQISTRKKLKLFDESWTDIPVSLDKSNVSESSNSTIVSQKSTKRKPLDSLCHPTVKKLRTFYSNISIPEKCRNLNIDPVVVLSRTVIDDWILNNLKAGTWGIDASRNNKTGLYLTRTAKRPKPIYESSSESEEDEQSVNHDPAFKPKIKKSYLYSSCIQTRNGYRETRQNKTETKQTIINKSLTEPETKEDPPTNTLLVINDDNVLVEKKSTKLYICQTCNQIFDTQKILQFHQKKHQSSLRCSKCSQSFTIVEDLIKHNSEKHGVEPPDEKTIQPTPQTSQAIESTTSAEVLTLSSSPSLSLTSDPLVISSDEDDIPIVEQLKEKKKEKKQNPTQLTTESSQTTEPDLSRDSDSSSDFRLVIDEDETKTEETHNQIKPVSLADEEYYLKYVFEKNINSRKYKQYVKYHPGKKSWILFNMGTLLEKSFIPVEFVPDIMGNKSDLALNLQYKFTGNKRPKPKSTSYRWNVLDAIDIPKSVPQKKKETTRLSTVLTSCGQLCDVPKNIELVKIAPKPQENIVHNEGTPIVQEKVIQLKSTDPNKPEHFFAKVLPNGSFQILPNLQVSPNNQQNKTDKLTINKKIVPKEIKPTNIGVVHKPIVLPSYEQQTNVSIQNYLSINVPTVSTNTSIAPPMLTPLPTITNVRTESTSISDNIPKTIPSSTGTILLQHSSVANANLVMINSLPNHVSSNGTVLPIIQHPNTYPETSVQSIIPAPNNLYIPIAVSTNETSTLQTNNSISMEPNTSIPSIEPPPSVSHEPTDTQLPKIRLKNISELTNKRNVQTPPAGSTTGMNLDERLKLQNLYVKTLTNYVNSSLDLVTSNQSEEEYLQIS